jgi:hypothetical protein
MEGKSWYFDMSDYAPILKGDKRLLITLGGQWQEDMDLEFQFIVGTPPRDVVQYEQIWQATYRTGIATIQNILNDEKLTEKNITLNADASSFKLKSSITGHGSEGEFHQNGGEINHKLFINGDEKLNWNITQECSMNPIYPQGGTWVYDRQGWCPGQRTLLREVDATSFFDAQSEVTIDYSTSNPILSTGDYKYHVAHQLVGYGAANHQLDAAIVDVVAPNNSALYTRVGTVCANPTIIIQNTGAETLNSLTIEYWINDALNPQSYEWTGVLEFMEKEEVIIPSPKELWYDVISENNKFYVEISDPNSGNDEYEFNNTFISSFDVPDIMPENFVLEFKTNNNPSENSYELVDDAGNMVSQNNLPNANTLYSDTLTLEGGCYKLTVSDLGGDGVYWWANTSQGTGYIRVKETNGIIIQTFEPDFGGSFEYNFSIEYPISAAQLKLVTSIQVFPNPINDYCFVKLNDNTNVDVYLCSLSGKKVTAPISKLDSELIKIDTRNLSSGLFILCIGNENGIITRKIIKE